MVQFFLMEGDLVCLNVINGLMAALRITHDLDEWRLFIGSSKTILKVALLHNEDVLLSIQCFICFLCEQESRARESHYATKVWS